MARGETLVALIQTYRFTLLKKKNLHRKQIKEKVKI